MSSGAPQQNSTQAVVGPVVLSYPNIMSRRASTGPGRTAVDADKEQPYDGEFLIYSDNPRMNEIAQKIYSACQAACFDKFGPDKGAQKMQKFWGSKPVVRDVVTKENYTGPPGLFFRAKSYRRPEVVKRDPSLPPNSGVYVPVVDPEEVYSGVIVMVSVNASVYDTKDEKGMPIEGVSLYLNHLLIVADGPRLGIKVTPASDVFAGVANQIAQYALPASPQQQVVDTAMQGYSQWSGQPAQAPQQAAGGFTPPMQQTGHWNPAVQPQPQYAPPAGPPAGYQQPPVQQYAPAGPPAGYQPNPQFAMAPPVGGPPQPNQMPPGYGGVQYPGQPTQNY